MIKVRNATVARKNSILANGDRLRGTLALGGQLSDLNIEDSHADATQSQ